MITLKLKQGTDEWLEARLNHLTASEAPAMMGDSKFMSRNQLLALKKGWKSNPNNKYKEMLFQKGHEFEALTRDFVEAEIEEDLYQVTGKIVVNGLELLASFDGLTCDEVTLWEHKMWNATLAENVRNGVLEPHYYWQLEHQLLVCGADRCIFSVSNGTVEKYISMDYVSIPERREALILGWAQFEKDLTKYKIEAIKEVVVSAKAESFPLITYQVTGTEISSNIADCLDIITQRSQVEMTRVLETDQDFADKDQLNKATIKARASLKTMLKEVESKFVSYSEFATVAAQIDVVMQKMQSHGEKQVKKAKADKKQAIEDAGIRQVINHIDEINKVINPIGLSSLMNCLMDFESAMKNKRTIESLQNAVDEVVAQFKIDSDKICAQVKVNLTTLRELAGDHKFLFTDTPQLVIKENEDLVAVIKTRIADHQKAEEEKLEAERKKIREEEEVKAREKIEEENRVKQEREVKTNSYLDKLRSLPTKFSDQSSTIINAEIVSLSRFMVTEEEFGNRVSEVTAAVEVAISQLDSLRTNAEQIEHVDKVEAAKEPEVDENAEIGKEERQLINEASEGIDSLKEHPLKLAINKKQQEVNAGPVTSEHLKGFLEWCSNDKSTITDFGYLLVDNDPMNNAQALDNIRQKFAEYLAD